MVSVDIGAKLHDEGAHAVEDLIDHIGKTAELCVRAGRSITPTWISFCTQRVPWTSLDAVRSSFCTIDSYKRRSECENVPNVDAADRYSSPRSSERDNSRIGWSSARPSVRPALRRADPRARPLPGQVPAADGFDKSTTQSPTDIRSAAEPWREGLHGSLRFRVVAMLARAVRPPARRCRPLW